MADFPAPPSGLGSYATLAANDDYFASPEQQARAATYPGQHIGTDREAAAEAATVDSLRHVLNEYARRSVREAVDEINAEDNGECELHDIEFVPAGRLANDTACFAVFGLTFVVLLPVMTRLVLIVLGTGAMITYVLDSLGHRRPTMAAIIATLVAGWMAFYFANFADAWHSPSAMLIVLSVAMTFVMAGLRALLSFKTVQTDSPGFALMAESALNAGLPLVATPPLIAAVVGVVGARLAPFAVVPLVCAAHYTFYRPMQSSFLEITTETRHAAAEELVLMVGPVEAAIGTAFTVLLPALLYPALSTEAAEFTNLNIFNVVFLVSAPLFYLVAFDPRLTLWFFRYLGTRFVEVRVKASIADEEAAGEGDSRSPTIKVRRSWLDTVLRRRALLAFIFYSGIMHFAVERLVNSRFAYLVVGIVPPFNYLVLTMVGYLGSAAAACALKLATDSAKKKPTKKDDYTTGVYWTGALLFSVGATIGLGVVAGMPGFFIPMLSLSAACFVAYLVDRRATNNFVTFMCASTITLTWWMFRTFSFIRQDLRVIGERFTVSTTEVAGGVLLAYILGGACIPLAFQRNKVPLAICMVFHGLKVMFVEHVLYSQPEATAYPFYFVLGTSVVGVTVAYRLYRNEVLADMVAAYIMGLYASKFFVYLVQINVAENEEASYATELMITELFSMAACAVLAIAEIRHSNKINITTQQFLSVLISWYIVLAGGMRDTVLRVAVEAVGIVRPSTVQLAAASGIACGLFGLVLASRYTSRVNAEDDEEAQAAARQSAELRGRLRKYMLYCLLASTTLLIADPAIEGIVTGEGMEGIDDDPLLPPWWCRWAVVGVFGLIYGGVRLPLHLVHPAVRGLYLVVCSVLLSVAASPIVVPVNDVRIVACLGTFFAMSAATVVACHHGKFESDVCLILYLVSLVALAIGFIALGWLDQETTSFTAEVLARMGMLSVGAGTNLLVALILKFYLNGKPVLSGARKLDSTHGSQVALVLNYAVVICFTTLSLLAYWIEVEPSSMLVLASAVLLLLHNDGVLLVRLNRGPFRYFPPFVAVCATLTWHVQHEVRDLYQAGRTRRALFVLAGVLALVPAHASLARFLWAARKRRTTVAKILGLVVWEALILLSTPSHGVRWAAGVGIVALVGRLVIAGHMKPIADIAAM